MTTTDTVLLIILTALLSLFIIVCITAVVVAVKLLNAARRVAIKAEQVVDSVEAAAETFKDVGGRLALIKLVKNIVNMGRRGKK